MRLYKIGVGLSAAAFAFAAINLIIRVIFKISPGFSVGLLVATALIFCGCLTGLVSRKNSLSQAEDEKTTHASGDEYE